MFVYTRIVCTYVFVYHRVCLVTWYSISDSLVRSEHDNGRFGVLLVMDPIHWRFEDWPMRWSGFVQWRPDRDSDPKPCRFMWMFAYVLFPYLPLSVCVYILMLSFHVTFRYILPVLLPVSLHETSENIYHIYLVDMNTYWRHFMW